MEIAARGLRSSWASMARNSSLRRASSASARLGPPPLGHVAEDQDHALDLAARARIGAPLSSMGRSVPSRAISTVWLARPTTSP